jgi:glycosyltransferase involved in cell wall biosynthesis
LGDGSEAQIMASHKMADELGLEKICKWHGSIPQNEVFKIMRESDIFFFSSLEEGTPHVVLEAIQNSLPVICFDNCGHGDSVDETIGKKIKVTNPEQSILEFSKIIDYFYHNRDELEKLAGNCQKKQKELSWDSKIKEMLTVYEKVLS